MRDAQFTEQWLMEQVARKHGTPRPSRRDTPGSTIEPSARAVVRGGVGGGAIERDSPRNRSVDDLKHSTPGNSREPVSNPAPSPISFTLDGQCPSGKNQVQLLWRNGKVHRYPNKMFTNWRSRATVQILAQYTPGCLTRPVTLTCTYWPGDRRIRDVSGQLDAIFSLLVHARVLKDDGLVYDCLWTRMEVSHCPKVQLHIMEWARSVEGGA